MEILHAVSKISAKRSQADDVTMDRGDNMPAAVRLKGNVPAQSSG